MMVAGSGFSPNADLLQSTPRGLYCAAGEFYLDPWRPVDRAIITHAHSDHARSGPAHYLAHRAAEGVLRIRLGQIDLQCVEYDDRPHQRCARIAASRRPCARIGAGQDRASR